MLEADSHLLLMKKQLTLNVKVDPYSSVKIAVVHEEAPFEDFIRHLAFPTILSHFQVLDCCIQIK